MAADIETALCKPPLFRREPGSLPEDCAVITPDFSSEAAGRDRPFTAAGAGFVCVGLVCDVFAKLQGRIVERGDPGGDADRQHLFQDRLAGAVGK